MCVPYRHIAPDAIFCKTLTQEAALFCRKMGQSNTMKKITAPYLNLLLLTAPFLFCRCGTYHAYFQSPFHGGSETYHAIPLKSDSLRSATYVTGVLTMGWANDDARDNISSFSGSFHRSHNFGSFQGYYGASATVGSYYVGNYSDYNYGYNTSARTLRTIPNTGSKFFGGYSAGGGIDVVVPFARGSEWRVAGVSFTLQKEYGDYRSFRKTLPDSLADVIFNNNLIGVLGLSTEVVFKGRHGTLGYKLMLAGDILNANRHYRGFDSTGHDMRFFQQTLSLTHHRVTGFFQFNVGYLTLSGQLGVGYRLGARKKN